MKLLKLIPLSVCLAISITMLAQNQDTVDIYYDYELIPTGMVIDQTDTSYNVFIIIDSTDVVQFEQITVEDEMEKKDIKFSSKAPSSNEKITKDKEKFKIDTDQWSGQSSLKVKAKKKDGTIVSLKHISGKNKVKHKEIRIKPKTRDVTFFEGDPIIEEENEL